MQQTLRYQFQEAAPEEDFSKANFAWLVLPEFHLVLPVIGACYVSETRMFRVFLDLSQDRWVPKIKFIEAPKCSGGDDIKQTMDKIALAIYDDPKVRGTFWLVPEQKIQDDGLPEKWLQFDGQYLAGLAYMEPGRTILSDSDLEAACEILVTTPITKWGNWQQQTTTKGIMPAGSPPFGQIVGDLATLFGCTAKEALKNWNKKAEESRALNARQGSFYSYMPYPMLFDQIANQLSEPIGKHSFSVSSDRQLMAMGASTSWHDYGCQGVPDMPQRLDLRLKFVPDRNGTRIDYEWLHYHQFAPGVATNQLVNIINGWIKHIAESVPAPKAVTVQNVQQPSQTPKTVTIPQPAPEPVAANKPHRLVPTYVSQTPPAKTIAAAEIKVPPVGSQEWTTQIRIDWPVDSGYDPCIFTPKSPLQELRRLIYVYECRDAYCLLFMDDSDYARVKSWIKVRETN